MSLEGAKFICLDEAGNHGEIVVAKGRKFTMGYYVSCDLVLADERAKGVHCEIECDAFGRVTIRNLSPNKPILVNGSIVEIKRILLNNSKLTILDKEYLWQFPKSSSNEFEDLTNDAVSTPQKQIGIPEQPPNSCPDFKLHRELPKRLTVHNFAYCIQSDEEGNTSVDSNDESITEDKKEETQKEVSNTTQVNKDDVELKSEHNSNDARNRSVTPEPPPVKNDNCIALLETPKLNLINCTIDKENKSTQKKNKQLLRLCQPSDVVITSFSPRETGVKVEKTFTAIINSKVQVTKPPTTPKSVYSTPRSELGVEDDGDERELMNFHTPSTSKKAAGTASKVLKTSSMHLVDLTTPSKLGTGSPFLKSALKASTKKTLNETIDTSSSKLALEEQFGLMTLPSTPMVNCNNSGLETPSSVISVSSTDTSSVVELMSDGSDLGITPSSSGGLMTPMKSQARAGACTPKRTPQSLMKRALLTSAKKQAATPQRGTSGATTTTPRREAINRIPLRSNLALLGSPVTPKADKNESQLPRRQSMSTPTRKSILARNRFDNSPSTSNFAVASPSSSSLASKRSSINPISAARALPTSTPLSGSSNSSSFRNRAACKTSPLHKVRKSVGGIPLSSHISKARKSLASPASTSKLSLVKEKSPQQVVSGRLVSRARKSFCTTPISARNMVTVVKTPPTCPSILKDTQKERKPVEQRKAVLFAETQPPKDDEMDDLSRTFVVDSEEEDNGVEGNVNGKPKDSTFSPEKDKQIDETDKASTTLNTTFSPEKKTGNMKDVQNALNNDLIETFEIPVDVEEITSTKENKDAENNKTETETSESNVANQETDAKVNNNENNKDTNNEFGVEIKTDSKEVDIEKQSKTAKESCDETNEFINQIYSPSRKDNGDDNKELSVFNNEDSLVTEESFGEIINDVQHTHDVLESIEISQGSQESSKTEIINNDVHEGIEEIFDTLNVIESIEITEGPPESSETKSQESFGGVENISQEESDEVSLSQNKKQSTKVADRTTEDPNKNLEKEETTKIEEAEVVETGFGEESIIVILEASSTENAEQYPAEEVKPNKTVDKIDNDDHIKPESIALVEEDNVKEKVEIESNDDIVQESKIIEHLGSEVLDDLVTNINTEEEKTEMYKPICEDITLEGSLIEKETNKLEEHKPVKQPLYDDITLEISEEEESDRNECNLQEINEHSEDEMYQESPKGSENVEHLDFEESKETLEQPQMETVHEEENQLRSKHSLEEPKIETLTVKEIAESKTESITKTSNNDHEILIQMEINETVEEPLTEIDKVKEQDLSMQADTSKVHIYHTKHSQIVDQFELKESNEFYEQTDKEIDQIAQEKVLQEPDVLENLVLASSEINTDENTSKLLEEIEDVLNKSDEIKQKHFEEMHGQESQTPLTEEFESEETNLAETYQTEVIATLDKYPNESEHIEPENRQKKIVAETTNTDIEIKESQCHTTTLIEHVDTSFSDEKISNSLEKSEHESQSQENVLAEAENCEIVFEAKAQSEETVADTKSQLREIIAETKYIPETTSETTKITEDIPSVCSIKKKFENTTTLTPRRGTRRSSISAEASTTLAAESSLTPRRSTRRTSLSAEVSSTFPNVEATLTPRRSTRRASMSSESTNTCTPIKNATRRISLSAVNETPLTPKRVSSRRSSLDDKPLQPVHEAKTPRTKTPRKQLLEQRIPEEKAEDMDAIIEEEEEEPTVEKIISNEEIKKNVSEQVLEDFAKETDTLGCQENEETGKTVAEEVSEEINVAEDCKEIVSKEVLELKIKDETDILESKANENTNADLEIINEEDEVPNAIVTDEVVSVETLFIDDNIGLDADLMEHKVDDSLLKDDNAITENITINDSKEIVSKVPETVKISDDKVIAEIENISDDKSTEGFENEIVESKEIETPKSKISVNIVADLTKTPLMMGMRELLKTPKADLTTSKFSGIRDLVRTPKVTSEREEEVEKLAKVDEVLTPKSKKSIQLIANTPEAPLMMEISDLLKTPKPKVEHEEEVKKLAVLTHLVKTETPKSEKFLAEKEVEEIATTSTKVVPITTPKTKKSVKIIAYSPKTPIMAGMRELLKTPKADKTPKFAGIRNLVQTPKQTLENDQEETEKLAGVAELVKTPEAKISQDFVVKLLEEIPTTSAKDANLRGVRELLNTPKSCSTPRFKGMRELMQTPKMCSTPLMGGIKELMNSPAKMDSENMDKFLKTPTAKNIMIPSLPSSAIIEKSTDSIEVSTEYDLNVTNEGGLANLEELFKTPVASRFVDRITASYYAEDGEDHDEAATIFNQTEKETLQEKLNKSAEDAFDEFTGQETQINTPIRKIYPRKSLGLQTPQPQSPFSTADVLSDLPKTDVEEWIETLDQAETPIVVEEDNDDGNVVVEEEIDTVQEVIIDEVSYLEDSFVEQDKSFTQDESVIPETCAKVYLNEKCVANVTSTSEVMLNLSSIAKTNSKDPLTSTTTKLLPKVTCPSTSMDAEISGIDLLDQTVESVQEELSIIEEPSMFEEHLVVSDNESEADVTVNNTGEINEELNSLGNLTSSARDGDENDLSEPLLVSDSEDLDLSLELKENVLEDVETNASSLYFKNGDHSSANNPLESTLADFQEQFADIIDLETSEFEDETSNGSYEENKSILKPESRNNSKDEEKSRLTKENSVVQNSVNVGSIIEDADYNVSSIILENLSKVFIEEKSSTVAEDSNEDSKKLNVSLIEDDPNEDSENNKKSVTENIPVIITEDIENLVLEDSIIEDSLTESRHGEGAKSEIISSLEEATLISKTVKSGEEKTTEHSSNEQETSTVIQNDEAQLYPAAAMENVDVFENVKEILKADQTPEQSKILENEIEHEKKLEVSIKETRKVSDIFMDESMTEICNEAINEIVVAAEPSTSNEAQIIDSAEATPKERNKEFDQECEDIFMDSSANSFADKATNDEKDVENESAMVEVITKEMSTKDSESVLSSGEAIKEKNKSRNEADVATDDPSASKQVLIGGYIKVGSNSKAPSNEEVKQLSAENKKQLENILIAQEISDDENQTVTKEVAERLKKVSQDQQSTEVKQIPENISKDQHSNTFVTTEAPVENITESVLSSGEAIEENNKSLNEDVAAEDRNVSKEFLIEEDLMSAKDNCKAPRYKKGKELREEEILTAQETSDEETQTVTKQVSKQLKEEHKDQQSPELKVVSENISKDQHMITFETTESAVESIAESILSSGKAIEENNKSLTEDVVTEDQNVYKDVLIREDKEPSNEEVQQLSDENEKLLEDAQEISDDGNETVTKEVAEQLKEEHKDQQSAEVNEVSENISEDQQSNTFEIIESPVKDITEIIKDDESVSQTNKDSSNDVNKSVTGIISEDFAEPEDNVSKNTTETSQNVSEYTEKDFNNTEQEPFDISATAPTESGSSKELSGDIIDILESDNKLKETNDNNSKSQLEKPVALHLKTEEIKPCQTSTEVSQDSSMVDIKQSLDIEKQNFIITEEYKSVLTSKSQNKNSSVIEHSEIPEPDETTDKDHQNSEEVVRSAKDKSSKSIKEPTEVDIAQTSAQTACNEIEIVQTYDIKVTIIDTESKNPTETKSDNSKLQIESLKCSNPDLAVLTREENDSKTTTPSVEKEVEHSTKYKQGILNVSETVKDSLHEVVTTRKDRNNDVKSTTVEEVVLKKSEENEEQTNVSIEKPNKEALISKIAEEETTVCVVEAKRETARPHRRKRTASDSSQGSVHDEDNKLNIRRGRRKVQKIPVEETLAEEIKEDADLVTVSSVAAAAVKHQESLVEHEEKNIDEENKETHEEKNEELPAASNHKEVKETKTEKEKNELSADFILEEAKPKITLNVVAVEKGKEQAADVLETIDANAVEKTKEEVVKRVRRKATVSECSQGSVYDDDCSTRRGRCKVQKTHVEENEEVANVSTPAQQYNELYSDKATLVKHKQEVENAISDEQVSEAPKQTEVQAESLESRKEHMVKRVRRKPTVSESSQGSINGDDTTHSQRARRKVKKTRVEEPLVEEELPTTSTGKIVEKEDTVSTDDTPKEKLSTVAPAKDKSVIESTGTKEIPVLIVEVTEPLIERTEKQEPSSDLPLKKDKNLASEDPKETHVPTKTLEDAKKQVVKHGRRKPTVSESSQDSVFDEDSTSRRGRRKVLNASVDKPLVEEIHESAKLSSVFTETVSKETNQQNQEMSTMGLALDKTTTSEPSKEHANDSKQSDDSSRNSPQQEQITLIEENITETTAIAEVNETEAIVIKESETNIVQEPNSSQIDKLESSVDVDDVILPTEEEASTENKQQFKVAATEHGDRQEEEVIFVKRSTKRAASKATIAVDVELPKSRSRSRNRKSPTRQPSATVNELPNVVDIVEGKVDASESHKPETKILSTSKIVAIVIREDENIDQKQQKVQDDYIENDLKLKFKSNKIRGKRTRTASESSLGSVADEEPTKRRARQHKQMPDIDEAIVEETENKIVIEPATHPTTNNHTLNTEIIEKSFAEETAIEKKDDELVEPQPHSSHNEDIADKPKISLRGFEEATTHKAHVEQQEEQSTKTEKQSQGKDIVDEPKNIKLTEVQITEVNLEPEDQHSSPEVKEKEVRGRRGRHHVVAEDEHREIKHATKRSAAVAKHITGDHQESGPVSKKRVGRRKQDNGPEEHAHATHVTADDCKNYEETSAETIIHEEPKKTRGRRKKEEHPAEPEHPKTSEQEKHGVEVSHEENAHIETASTSSKRRVGRRKQTHHEQEHDHGIQVTVDESKPLEEKSMDSLAPEQEPKKGRGRRKKDEQPEEPDQSTTSHSPEAKPRGRKRKESHTDTEDLHHPHKDDPTPTKINLLKTDTALSLTLQRATPRRGRKASAIDVDRHIHIVVEGAEDTPSKRPLRKAATVYHNYDETSNDAVLPTRTKKKTDSPRKSMEAPKASPTATVTTVTITGPSPTSSSTTAATTARGRTRKPTARVQQFLEEERAKAETPKKRGLLTAGTDLTDTSTPQRMPARRGRKPSTIDVEVDTSVETPQASKRGRGKAIAYTEELQKEAAYVIEEKETEPTTTPSAATATKGRRAGRKAKITADDHNQDEDEPPPASKKSPLVLEAEKQVTSALEGPTPTRTAGRRGAATAAKARIEEDALAAAAIDPPKKARAKKMPAAKTVVVVATAAATDTEGGHSSEMDEEQSKAKSLKAEDFNSAEDNENDIIEKPVNKRGARKAVASTSATDSPAVPSKRGRKAKTVSEATETEAAGEVKAPRGAGRGRKNVHFDEIQVAEKAVETLEHLSATEQTSDESAALAKRGTRTRRK